MQPSWANSHSYKGPTQSYADYDPTQPYADYGPTQPYADGYTLAHANTMLL